MRCACRSRCIAAVAVDFCHTAPPKANIARLVSFPQAQADDRPAYGVGALPQHVRSAPLSPTRNAPPPYLRGRNEAEVREVWERNSAASCSRPSRKVFTLNLTAAAVVREIAAGGDEDQIAVRVVQRRNATPDHPARSALVLSDSQQGSCRGLKPVRPRCPAGQATGDQSSAAASGAAERLVRGRQITNECNFACKHRIERAVQGSARDELDETQVFAALDV
jgi:hypothetical protein